MTIWLKEDTEQERGMVRFFDTSNDAIRRFFALKEDLYACIIEKVTETGEEVCIFSWHREGEQEEKEEDQYQSICDHEGCDQQLHIDCAIQIVTNKLTREERTVCSSCYHDEYYSNEEWKNEEESESEEE